MTLHTQGATHPPPLD